MLCSHHLDILNNSVFELCFVNKVWGDWVPWPGAASASSPHPTPQQLMMSQQGPEGGLREGQGLCHWWGVAALPPEAGKHHKAMTQWGRVSHSLPIQVPSVSHGEILILWMRLSWGGPVGRGDLSDLVADGRGPSSPLEWPESRGEAPGSPVGLPGPRHV